MSTYALPAAYGALASLFVSMAMVDLRRRRIPNLLVALSVGVALAAVLLSPRWTHTLGESLVGSAFMVGPFWLMAALGGLRQTGGGDVKMALAVGFVAGYPGVLLALILTILQVMGYLLVTHRRLSVERRGIPELEECPMAPFLTVATLGTLAVFNPWEPLLRLG